MENKSFKNVREEALRLLERIENEGAYSHLLLNHVLNEKKVAKKDEALLTELVYGTMKRKNTLDFYLSPFIKKGLESLETWVQQLLRMSVYQIVYLDRVPDRAVVHEAVQIAKKKGHKGISGLINGVLRSLQRKGLPDPAALSGVKRLSIETSHPAWLLEDWIDAYGGENAKRMALTNLKPPSLSVRVNPIVCSAEEVKKQLTEEGCTVEEGVLSPGALIVTSGSVLETDAYKKGFVTIQDESSMLPAILLDPQPDMHVVDACAAPGGKTTQMAERMENRGKVYGFDLHKKKLKFIEEQAERLHLSVIEADALDARKLTTRFEENSIDRILVDVPCSGFGVIRRKPELKWQKQRTDVGRFPVIQKEILEEAARLLKPGGRLVYSTCTVRKEENEEVVEAFLQGNPKFQKDGRALKNLPGKVLSETGAKDGQATILPHYFETDGFFMAAMTKSQE